MGELVLHGFHIYLGPRRPTSSGTTTFDSATTASTAARLKADRPVALRSAAAAQGNVVAKLVERVEAARDLGEFVIGVGSSRGPP